MGALEYEPDYNIISGDEIKNLDFLSEQCSKILRTEYSEELDTIYKMGGSSGGARPKILTEFVSTDNGWRIDSIGYNNYTNTRFK